MLNLKKIKPIGCQVLVTEELYGYDDASAAGVIIHKKGDLKSYQTVLAVGDDVKFVKPGDVVAINFYKYCVFENDPNSVKVNGSNKIVDIRLDEVELVDDNGELNMCILIDQRDIKYIIEESEEVKYDKDDNLIKIESPKTNLILPSNRIRI